MAPDSSARRIRHADGSIVIGAIAVIAANLGLWVLARAPIACGWRLWRAWGQSISLTFVGGICVSLFFQSFRSLNTLQSLVIYTVLVAVALGLFFSSMWSIHVALAAARQRELATVRLHWQQARLAAPRQLAALPAAEAVREPGVLLDRRDRDPGLPERARGAARREDGPPALRDRGRELRDTGLVPHREERGPDRDRSGVSRDCVR